MNPEERSLDAQEIDHSSIIKRIQQALGLTFAEDLTEGGTSDFSLYLSEGGKKLNQDGKIFAKNLFQSISQSQDETELRAQLEELKAYRDSLTDRGEPYPDKHGHLRYRVSAERMLLTRTIQSIEMHYQNAKREQILQAAQVEGSGTNIILETVKAALQGKKAPEESQDPLVSRLAAKLQETIGDRSGNLPEALAQKAAEVKVAPKIEWYNQATQTIDNNRAFLINLLMKGDPNHLAVSREIATEVISIYEKRQGLLYHVQRRIEELFDEDKPVTPFEKLDVEEMIDSIYGFQRFDRKKVLNRDRRERLFSIIDQVQAMTDYARYYEEAHSPEAEVVLEQVADLVDDKIQELDILSEETQTKRNRPKSRILKLSRIAAVLSGPIIALRLFTGLALASDTKAQEPIDQTPPPNPITTEVTHQLTLTTVQSVSITEGLMSKEADIWVYDLPSSNNDQESVSEEESILQNEAVQIETVESPVSSIPSFYSSDISIEIQDVLWAKIQNSEVIDQIEAEGRTDEKIKEAIKEEYARINKIAGRQIENLGLIQAIIDGAKPIQREINGEMYTIFTLPEDSEWAATFPDVDERLGKFIKFTTENGKTYIYLPQTDATCKSHTIAAIINQLMDNNIIIDPFVYSEILKGFDLDYYNTSKETTLEEDDRLFDRTYGNVSDKAATHATINRYIQDEGRSEFDKLLESLGIQYAYEPMPQLLWEDLIMVYNADILEGVINSEDIDKQGLSIIAEITTEEQKNQIWANYLRDLEIRYLNNNNIKAGIYTDFSPETSTGEKLLGHSMLYLGIKEINGKTYVRLADGRLTNSSNPTTWGEFPGIFMGEDKLYYMPIETYVKFVHGVKVLVKNTSSGEEILAQVQTSDNLKLQVQIEIAQANIVQLEAEKSNLSRTLNSRQSRVNPNFIRGKISQLNRVIQQTQRLISQAENEAKYQETISQVSPTQTEYWEQIRQNVLKSREQPV